MSHRVCRRYQWSTAFKCIARSTTNCAGRIGDGKASHGEQFDPSSGNGLSAVPVQGFLVRGFRTPTLRGDYNTLAMRSIARALVAATVLVGSAADATGPTPQRPRC